jgi:hypothetical protein
MSAGSAVNPAAAAAGACGCCQGSGPAPVRLANRPGLSALAYRVGTQASFKRSMLAAISTKPALRALTTRDDDDLAIALLDAWAVTLDVLSFYQERIADEGFLRTATERRSLLELARTIGYELRPGVAASTWLAFTLDASPGSPLQVTIPAGTRAQSLPTTSEAPQSFETGADLLARPEWNALRPQLLAPQSLGGGATRIVLAGVATRLRPGDALLLLAADESSGDLRLLTSVAAAGGVTTVTWQGGLDIAVDSPPRVYALRQRAALFGATAPDWKGLTFDFKNAYVTSLGKLALTQGDPASWPPDWPDAPAIGAAATTIDLDAVYPRIAPLSWVVLQQTLDTGTPQQRISRVTGVDTVSRSGFGLAARVTRLTVETAAGNESFGMRETAVFAESEELALAQTAIADPVQGKVIDLDGLVGGLVHGRAVVVQGRQMRVRVDGAPLQLQLADGSGEVDLGVGETLQVLERPAGTIFTETWRLRDRDGVEGTVTLDRFLFAAVAVPELVLAAGALVFARPIGPPLPGLRAAPAAVGTLTLVPSEDGDPVVAEVALLDAVTLGKQRTTLQLADPLSNLFDRVTVAVLANVAAATHGETRREVLGGGDAAKRFQRFRLRQQPLTNVPAPVAGGAESTLELRANGVLWHEAPDLYQLGPRDRQYALRRDDDGSTTVRFGDGVHGARLPSGAENVEAVYRTGIGLAGLVAENRISLIPVRPLGVKSVTNPLAATGAADPESRDQARANVSTTVLTLDRIVSLRDFEDFARAFSGIGKARARMLWASGRQLVHLTIAGVGGLPVPSGSALDLNLRQAMDRLRDPFQALVVDSYEQLRFRVGVRVKVDPDYVPETVLAQVEAALRDAFSFAARDFGQGVFLSEVMAVAQGVAGAVYLDLTSLRFENAVDGTLADRLTALPARIDDTGQVLRAQILTLSPALVAPEAIT